MRTKVKTVKPKIITIKKMVELIRATNKEEFTVSFIKRTTGETRKMVAMYGVTEFLRGGELGYDAKEQSLITVYDTEKKGYRSINIDGIIAATIKGIEYLVRL
jgi:hypothetical protein